MKYDTLFGQLKNKPNSKVQLVWVVSDILFFAGAAVVLYLVSIAMRSVAPLESIIMVSLVLCILACIARLVLILFEYKFYSYEITQDYVEIQKGFLVKKRTVIPFVRVQDIETEQGPLMRLVSLCTLKLSTASESHTIEGLPLEYARQLREQAAEFARLAREDV